MELSLAIVNGHLRALTCLPYANMTRPPVLFALPVPFDLILFLWVSDANLLQVLCSIRNGTLASIPPSLTLVPDYPSQTSHNLHALPHSLHVSSDGKLTSYCKTWSLPSAVFHNDFNAACLR